ncbi:MAG: hypothetical protein ACFE0J_05865 [Elainellaceae cyanobacterium]
MQILIATIASFFLGLVTNWYYDLAREKGWLSGNPGKVKVVLSVAGTSLLLLLVTLPELQIFQISERIEKELTNSCIPPSEYVPSGGLIRHNLDEDFDLNVDSYEETKLISFTQGDEFHKVSDLIVLGCQEGEWVKAFQKSFTEGCPFDAEEVEVMENGSKQVLIQQTCGSGGFLDFWLLGYQERNVFQKLIGGFVDPNNQNGFNSNIKVLLSSSDTDGPFFMGSVYPTENGLVVEEGDILWRYRWNGDKFLKERDSAFPSNALIVKYWWDENGNAFTDLEGTPKPFDTLTSEEIHLKVGQRLYLIRDQERDKSTASSRTMMGDVHLTSPVSGIEGPGLSMEAENVGELRVGFEHPPYSNEFVGFSVVVTE